MINVSNLVYISNIRENIHKIKFKEESINNFFDGGIENNCLIEISGEAGSGKTNMCISVALHAALSKSSGGLESNVLYISTVKKISNRRIEQIIKSFQIKEGEILEVMSRFHDEFVEASDFETYLYEIEKKIFDKKIKIIIIDSITGLSDVQFIKENNEVDFVARSQFLRRTINSFKNLIIKYNLFFFVTNNVSNSFTSGVFLNLTFRKLYQI